MAKNKGGRPSKYQRIDLVQVEKMAKLGLTDEQMAGLLEIHIDTFYEYKKKPEFSEAIKKGKEDPDSKVERSLFERAMGYSHPAEEIHFDKFGQVHRAETIKHYPPDPTSMIFWLKNRRPDKWRDKTEIEATGKDGGPLVIIDAGRNPYKG